MNEESEIAPLAVDAVTGLVCCLAPECNALLLGEVKNHLKNSHKRGETDALRVSSLVAVAVSEKLSSSTHDKEARNAVEFATERIADASAAKLAWPSEVVPKAFPSLKPDRKFMCGNCGYLELNEKKMKVHFKSSDHGDARSVRVMTQGFFRKNGGKKLFFRVDAPTPSAETLRAFVTECQEVPGDPEPQASAEQLHSFLFESHLDEEVVRMGLSLEKAGDLAMISKVDDKFVKPLRASVMRYFGKCFQAMVQAPVAARHLVFGERVSLSITDDSRKKYALCISRAIIFFWRILNSPKGAFIHDAEAGKNIIDVLWSSATSQGAGIDKSAVDGSDDQALHRFLMWALLTPVNGGCAIASFVACSAVQVESSGLRYGLAHEVSPILAALKYATRSSAVFYVLKEAKDSADGWEYVDRLTNSFVDCGATYVGHIMKVANRHQGTDAPLTQFALCTRHEHCALVQGNEISLMLVSKMVYRMQDRLSGLLFDEVLMGTNLHADYWSELGNLKDMITDQGFGRGIGQHRANAVKVRGWVLSLLNVVESNLTSSRESAKETEKGPDLKEDEARKWLELCQEVQRLLFTLLQLCCGGPARSTELQSVRILNSAHGSRGIFISDGFVFLVPTHSKTRSITNSSRIIARYPDAVTSGLLLTYVLVVRPVEVGVVRMLRERTCPIGSTPVTHNSVAEHQTFLFARDGMHIEDGSTIFERVMGDYGLRIGIRVYRQFQVGAVKCFLRGSGRIISEDYGHIQAGHSETMASERYAACAGYARSLTGSTLESFRMASKEWHDSLKLMHGPPARFGQHARDELEIEGGVGELENIGSGENNAQVGGFTAELSKRVCVIERKLDKILELVSRNGIDLNAPPLVSSISDVDLRGALRSMTGSDKSEFHSDEQLRAVRLSVSRRGDGIIILPTGGGKSMTFLLPSYLEKSGLTIVVAPLVALQQDLLRRCGEVGIQAALWADREQAGLRVLIISPEHISEGSMYKEFSTQKAKTGVLRRIVVDEGHLVLCWASFRRSMLSLQNNLRPEGVDVPLLILTATAPTSLVREIARACGSSKFETIRGTSARPNLIYEAIKLPRNQSSEYMRRGFLATKVESLRLECAGLGKSRFIVYARTRAEVDAVYQVLPCIVGETAVVGDVGKDTSHFVFRYHSGMSTDLRRQEFKAWQETDYSIMVATCAFGCGIDYGQVRAVIHFGLPRTILDYAQESGRAGRDARAARCIILYWDEEIDVRKRLEHEMLLEAFCSEPKSSEQALHSFPKQSDVRLLQLQGRAQALVGVDLVCRRSAVEGFISEGDGKFTCLGNNNSLESVEDPTVFELCDLCRMGIGDGGDLETPRTSLGTYSPIPNSSTDDSPPTARLQVVAGKRGGHESGLEPNGLSWKRRLVDGSGLVDEARVVEPQNLLRKFDASVCPVRQAARESTAPARVAAEILTRRIKELNSIAERLRTMCPKCSISKGQGVVRHGTAEQVMECMGRRCWKCGFDQCGASTCSRVRVPKGESSCYVCSVGTLGGQKSHESGTYGILRRCPFGRLFQLACLLMSTDDGNERLRIFMGHALPHGGSPDNLHCRTTIDWLRKCNDSTPNLLLFVRWVEAGMGFKSI